MPARLAQLLVSRMLLSQEKAGEVLRQHQAQGGHMDTVLLERGVAGEADVLALLGEVSGFRPVNLMDFGCVRIFPPRFVRGSIELYRALMTDDAVEEDPVPNAIAATPSVKVMVLL